MNIPEALELLKNDEPIVVRDMTFSPRGVDEVTLDTGESVFWVRGSEGMWLSIDPEGEEVWLFEDLEEEFEPEDDTVVYGGEDHEFSYEAKATILEEDGGTILSFKDYEGPTGKIVRIMEDESTGDLSFAYGMQITEEELQGA